MPPDSDGKELAKSREQFTVVCNLRKLFHDETHADKIDAWVCKAHSMTRLASQLLNFHARRCLEDESLPLPRFGYSHWAIQAWYAVTHVKRKDKKRKEDEALLETQSQCMPNVEQVDATSMNETLDSESERWAVTFSTNVYLHFPKRVKKYVWNQHQLSKEEYDSMSKPDKAQRRNALTKVAKDLCSDPSVAFTCPAGYHAFVTSTRAEWKLGAFPWQMYPGMPIAYHFKANDKRNPDKCNAHLLLPAMQCMLLDREARGQRGFAMLPLRTRLVPSHTMFSERMIRAALGLGISEEKKLRMKEYRKRRKLAAQGKQQEKDEEEEEDELGFAPLQGGHSTGSNEEASSSNDPLPLPSADAPEASEAPSRKRKCRPKAEVEEARHRDLLQIFDLKSAKVHDCVGKIFQCTFTSDGYAAHLHFVRPKPKPLKPNELPRRGVFDMDELRERMQKGGKKEKLPTENQASVVNASDSPKSKLEEVCKMRKKCLCCNTPFNDPFPGFICVGCDPGKNEPVCMADPLNKTRKMRMTLAGRRHHTLPGNYKLTERDMKQKEKKGGWRGLEDALNREKAAHSYRQEYVVKPSHINLLESEISQESTFHGSNAATLSGFTAYISAVRQQESILVPHYEQLHQRKLRFKAHVERQRFEGKFIRDIRRTFDPEGTGKTILLCWGAWGKVAGRPGTVGNRGHPPTIGVGLVKRLAKEDGIVVVWTPEHFTTKTHHKCGGECIRFTKAEERRARDADFLHSHKEIRGLKQCSSCGDPVNRDLNAALNIGTNGILLLSGCDPIHVHDEMEADTLNINNEMLGA